MYPQYVLGKNKTLLVHFFHPTIVGFIHDNYSIWHRNYSTWHRRINTIMVCLFAYLPPASSLKQKKLNIDHYEQ